MCDGLIAGFRFLFRLPVRVLLCLIGLYQRFLSPALPALFGSTCGCRFAPTCSHYAAEAIRTHGAIAGTLLAAIRLVKCTPLHPGGFDPVPSRLHRRDRAVSTATRFHCASVGQPAGERDSARASALACDEGRRLAKTVSSPASSLTRPSTL
jgi:putative membrane protein insertion efficiency factor